MSNIKSLITNISYEKEELISIYLINGIVHLDNYDKLINIIQSYLTKNLIKETSTIKFNNEAAKSLYNLEEIVPTYNDNKTVNIEIKFFKNDDEHLIVFSLDKYIEKIKNNLVKKDLILNTLNALFTKNIILIEFDSTKILDYVIDYNVPEEYTTEISKIINFPTSLELEVSPHNIDVSKIKKIDDNIVNKFYDLINCLKNFLSLLYISSTIDIKESNFEVFFDGSRERTLQLTNTEILTEFGKLDKYKNLYFWIYKRESDEKNQNFIEKLEIVRNLIAITFEDKKSLILLNSSVYDILQKASSNYKIYLKSKTKDYFDLRFKIEENVDNLFVRLGDEFTKFTDLFRNNLYVFISFIVSSTLFTILRSKSKELNIVEHTNNIFLSEDLSIIISICGMFSLLVLIVLSIRYYSNISAINNKLIDVQTKYSCFLDKDDLSNIVGESFQKRKKHNNILAFIIISIWAIVGICFVYNSKIYNDFYLTKNRQTTQVQQTQDVNQSNNITCVIRTATKKSNGVEK